MVKTPICNFCARTGVLCKRCSSRLRSGKIDEMDIEISKLLVKVENRFSFLTKVELKRTIIVNGYIVLAVSKGSKTPIFDNPQLLNLIAKEAKRQVKIVEIGSNQRATLSSLFLPLKVIGVDTVFVPDGSQELKIRLRGKEEDLALPLRDLEEIASKITKIHVRAHFEVA
ncbi:MAG: hypothetical protein ACFFDT_07595 [Candidatus Hodarchaeota archaeon]